MTKQRILPRRTLLLVLALLLALMPAAVFAVWTPLSEFFGTTSSPAQVSLGGEYVLESGAGISNPALGGGDYSIEGQVDGLLPDEQAEVPPQGPKIFLPIVALNR